MWSFVIFALVLAAILVGAGFYSGIIKRRDLARVMATVRHKFTDEARLRTVLTACIDHRLPRLRASGVL